MPLFCMFKVFSSDWYLQYQAGDDLQYVESSEEDNDPMDSDPDFDGVDREGIHTNIYLIWNLCSPFICPYNHLGRYIDYYLFSVENLMMCPLPLAFFDVFKGTI